MKLIIFVCSVFQNFRGQQLPSILTEDVDEGNETNEASVTTWTSGTRNPLHLFDSRNRHRSGGDDINNKGPRTSKTATNMLLDAFRPRSKSDASKLKRPNFMSNIRNAVQVCCQYRTASIYSPKNAKMQCTGAIFISTLISVYI